MPGPVILKRAYEAASTDDGQRVLVDRLWPRDGFGDEATSLNKKVRVVTTISYRLK